MDVEYELSAKRVELSVLEAEHQSEELWELEEYQRLRQRIAQLKDKAETEGADTTDRPEDGLVESASRQ